MDTESEVENENYVQYPFIGYSVTAIEEIQRSSNLPKERYFASGNRESKDE